MLDVKDWAEIRRLYRAEGLGIKTIARRLGVARNTVSWVLGELDGPRLMRANRVTHTLATTGHKSDTEEHKHV